MPRGSVRHLIIADVSTCLFCRFGGESGNGEKRREELDMRLKGEAREGPERRVPSRGTQTF